MAASSSTATVAGEGGAAFSIPEDLLVTPTTGGDLHTVKHGSVAGTPAAPVQMTSTGCVYAAWSDPQSPNNYLRDCTDDSDDDHEPIPGMQDCSRQFRPRPAPGVLHLHRGTNS